MGPEYANPASGLEVTVNLPVAFEGRTTLRIIDATGQVKSVSTTQIIGAYQLPIADLATSTYTAQALNGDQMMTTRVMIVR